MKAILEFDLSEPDQRLAHLRAVKADDAYSALWDFDNYLRDQIKYQNKYQLQNYRDRLHEIMAERNISFDEYD